MSSPVSLAVGRLCLMRVKDRAYEAEIIALAVDTIGLSVGEIADLEEGAGVELEIQDSSGTAHFHTRVVVPPRNAGDGVILQRCEAAQYLRHRRAWRVPTDFRIQLAPPSGIPNRDGRMLNLSAEGGLIVSKSHFDTGESCRVTITLTGQSTCTMKGRIIHGTDTTNEHGEFEYGLRFEEVPRESRHALTWFLYDRIRKIYGDELRAMYPRPRSSRKKQVTRA